MRQKTRRILVFISLLLFPVTMNYLSPYVSIDGAMAGIVSGSVITFALLFISGLFLGRAWCGWLCPAAGLGELCSTINSKQAPVRKLTIIRWSIFTIWLLILVSGFIMAGGIKGINPLHMTENFISIDEPLKYIMYYMVLAIFFVLNVSIGKRGACHTICWMSPFLAAGFRLGRLLHLPQLRIVTEPQKCINCKACDKKCPMSINVSERVKTGMIGTPDCILCGECADTCPKKVLKYGN
ncbi:MAG: 4Fe-4S binding protein [Clostridiales bacterium]|nr:4Fe-4S binding protein [Clostridiales bacterium]